MLRMLLKKVQKGLFRLLLQITSIADHEIVKVISIFKDLIFLVYLYIRDLNNEIRINLSF